MTTLTAPRTTNSVRPMFEALLLPIGPAAIAVLRYVLPYDTTDDTATITAKSMAEQGRMSAVLWLGFIAVLTLVPASYVVGRATRPGAPKLTTVAMLLLVPGYLALAWLAAADQFVWSGAEAGLDAAQVTRLVESAHPTTEIAAVFFVLGHVLGTILLGIALWRACRGRQVGGGGGDRVAADPLHRGSGGAESHAGSDRLGSAGSRVRRGGVGDPEAAKRLVNKASPAAAGCRRTTVVVA